MKTTTRSNHLVMRINNEHLKGLKFTSLLWRFFTYKIYNSTTTINCQNKKFSSGRFIFKSIWSTIKTKNPQKLAENPTLSTLLP
jgi:hypothetical protein